MIIERHKTALTRYELSRPFKLAIQDSVIRPSDMIFDYGCGKGDDVRDLESMGYKISAWDPYFRPDNQKSPSHVVNLGYVLNVIEDIQERTETLKEAYNLSERLLIVSVMPDISSNKGKTAKEYRDGYLNDRYTFQKLYSQTEIKDYIKDVLDIEPVAADIGIFYIFRNESDKEAFLQSRYRQKIHFSRRRRLTLADHYKSHRELIEDFMNTIYYLGRIPFEDEYSRSEELIEKLGSFKKSFRILHTVFPDNLIEERRLARRDELLVRIALSRFSGHPQFKNLPIDLQRDIKEFFGTYKRAREESEKELFLISDQQKIRTQLNTSKIGKQLPDALYIHRDYESSLSVTIQILIGASEILAGNTPEMNILKISGLLNRNRCKMSYTKNKGSIAYEMSKVQSG